MTADPFARLAPFIQSYIWKQGWTELRGIQQRATAAILDSDDHVLLASGTASGKTEAAFLPILTSLYAFPSGSVGVLYVGPLKALINDQFERLDGLLYEAGWPVTAWHGDAKASGKARVLKRPEGVIQITPESLESLMMRHPARVRSLFSDLRFVVIDEAHVFMGSERGRQLQCLLLRLERLAQIKPRRVGLSATLGDLQQAADWLSAGDQRRVQVIEDEGGARQLKLAMNVYDISDGAEDGEAYKWFMGDLYRHSAGRKSLIFCTSRHQVEDVAAGLRRVAQQRQEEDIFYVHHGSVSAMLRQEAEEAMRKPDHPAATVATVTLELGIDLGYLDRVLQVGEPSTVSSLVQRLGRTGRRGKAAEMLFYALYREGGQEAVQAWLPWTLLIMTAQLELYLRYRWVEAAQQVLLPFSLLAHQTMALLVQWEELTPRDLAREVLTLPPFAHVSREHFKALLTHLLDTFYLERSAEGGLLLGEAGERLMGHWSSCSVFEEQVEIQVYDSNRHVGSIGMMPSEGETFALAGSNWRCLKRDVKARRVYASRVQGRGTKSWEGRGAGVHDRVMAMVREVLLSDAEYAYHSRAARDLIRDSRAAVLRQGLASKLVHTLVGGKLLLMPWRGTRVVETMGLILRLRQVMAGQGRYYLDLACTSEQLLQFIHELPDEDGMRRLLIKQAVDGEAFEDEGRYREQVPLALRAEGYVYDQLDVDGAYEVFRLIRQELEKK